MRKLFLLFFCILWLSLSNESVAQCTFNISSSINQDRRPCELMAGSIFIVNVSGGVSPYTYQWSNGGTNSAIQDLMSGSYVVTVTDANNCSFIQSFYVPSAPVPPFSGPDISDLVITNATCGQANGSITGIFAQYSFNWYDETNNVYMPSGSPNAGPANVLNVPAGEYTISSYCFLNNTFTIGNDGLPSAETINQSTCDPTQVGTTTNTYTSVAGCDSTVTVITTLAPALNVSGFVGAEYLPCGELGYIHLTVSGGTPPHTYQWSNGSTNADISNLLSGNYSVTVTDANNCSVTGSYFVAHFPYIYDLNTNNLVITNATCGQANGSITGIISPASFYWWDATNNTSLGSSSGSGPAEIFDMPAGTYLIRSNCMETTEFVIGNDGLPSTETINQSTCDPAQVGTTTNTYTNVAGCDSTVTVIKTLIATNAEITQNGNTLTANNATADAYQWLDCNNGNAPIAGATTVSFTPTVSGNYALAVTQNGCTDNSDCVNIIVTAINPVDNNKIIVRLNNSNTAINIDGIQANTMANIYSIDGRLLLKKKLSNINEQLNIEHLTNGTYVLQLLNEQVIILNQKFVKQ